MTVFKAVQCENRADTTRLRVSLTVGLVSDVSITRSVIKSKLKSVFD